MNSMYWTKPHDTLLCREVLALEPYKHKKGSNEAGKIWTDIAQSLRNCQHLKFNVVRTTLYIILRDKFVLRVTGPFLHLCIQLIIEEYEH